MNNQEPATEWSADGKIGDYSTTSDLENNAEKHDNLGPDKNSFINPRMSSTIYITPNTDEDGMPIRKGTWQMASAHIITAVIGSGVLALPSTFAALGWIAGPISLLMFAVITYYCSQKLADCYRFPGPETGKRNYTYMDAVSAHLGDGKFGRINVFCCGLAQYGNLVATSIGYTVTAGVCLTAARRSICFHNNGPDADCHISNNVQMIVFGAIQLVFSQIPDFSKLAMLSFLAAAMSFGYSFIGIGMSIGKTTEHYEGHQYGSLGGYKIGVDVTSHQKAWDVLNSLGSIAFAYSFSMVLVEIQDTLKAAPTEAAVMKKATKCGISVTTSFYMVIGILGYTAFGDLAPGNLLTGFGFFNPYWLVAVANVFVFVHLVGAYQVYIQPWYAFIEHESAMRNQKRDFFIRERIILRNVPGLGMITYNGFRFCWRTVYVVVVTIIALLLPFFNDIVGFIGAIGFWPLTVYFPLEMHIAQNKIPKWSKKWIALESLSLFTFLISLGAAVGSVVLIVEDLMHYTPFQTKY